MTIADQLHKSKSHRDGFDPNCPRCVSEQGITGIIGHLAIQAEIASRPSARKPHRDFAGYVCELRNKYSGGHTVISDCKHAADSGNAIVENYVEEGGRYQVLCNEHGHLVYCTNLPVARECMKDPTTFCMVCRCIAGEGPENWENELAPHDVAAVEARRGAFAGQEAVNA